MAKKEDVLKGRELRARVAAAVLDGLTGSKLDSADLPHLRFVAMAFNLDERLDQLQSIAKEKQFDFQQELLCALLVRIADRLLDGPAELKLEIA